MNKKAQIRIEKMKSHMSKKLIEEIEKTNPNLLEELALNPKWEIMRLRNTIFQLLGNKCANPFNFPHPDWCNFLIILQIDHVNGGGCKERKEMGSSVAYHINILNKIKNGSKDYQLLCPNCNHMKMKSEMFKIEMEKQLNAEAKKV